MYNHLVLQRLAYFSARNGKIATLPKQAQPNNTEDADIAIKSNMMSATPLLGLLASLTSWRNAAVESIRPHHALLGPELLRLQELQHRFTVLWDHEDSQIALSPLISSEFKLVNNIAVTIGLTYFFSFLVSLDSSRFPAHDGSLRKCD